MKIQQFIEHLFNIGHDASATLIITILIFIIGYVIAVVAYIIKAFLKRRAMRKLFLENLGDFIKSIKQQQKNIEKTIKSLNIQENTSWEASSLQFHQISVFQEMNYTESFKSFFLGIENSRLFLVFMKWISQLISKKDKDYYMNGTKFLKLKRHSFNKLWETLNRIEKFCERAPQEFHQHLSTYNEHGTNRDIAMNVLRKSWENLFSFGKDNQKNLSDRELEYCTHLDNITYGYQLIPTKKRVQPFTTNRKLVLPIRILGKRFQDVKYTFTINNNALEVGHHYFEMEMLIRHLRDQYKIYSIELNSVRRITEKILKILE